MTGLFRKLIFALVPLVVLWGLSEMGLRTIGWPSVEGAFTHNEPFWVVDPDLQGQPTAHNEEQTSFQVSTNSDGLRAPLHSIEPGDSIWRVMTLGCSTTYGWGVADAASYPARLEALIHEQGRENVEVINGGQPGYTSFQGRWLWNERLKDYKPNVVMIGYIVQDARKAAYTDKSQAILQGDARFLKENLFYRSRVYLALQSVIGKAQIRAKERGEYDEGGVYRVPPEDYVENLRVLVGEVQSIGGTPVLFGYPLERSGYTSDHRMILKAAADELGILHFDPQAQMEQASRSGQYYFSRDRGHANADGNDLIARWVLDFLTENSLLGASEGGLR